MPAKLLIYSQLYTQNYKKSIASRGAKKGLILGRFLGVSIWFCLKRISGPADFKMDIAAGRIAGSADSADLENSKNTKKSISWRLYNTGQNS